jgi:hypothetical protein
LALLSSFGGKLAVQQFRSFATLSLWAQTSDVRLAMSEMGRNQTHAPQQIGAGRVK